MLTVREFVKQSYRLINPSNPSQPLHGFDQNEAITYLNQLLQYYASTGLLLTIPKEYSCPVVLGQDSVICGPSTYVPTPDIPHGRLANLMNAWLTLTGVSYPLIIEQRDTYLSSWKYNPLQGLPRFAIIFPETDIVRIRLYPAPSQMFTFNLYGKFQLDEFTSNDDMSALPQYSMRFFSLALARDLALYKGRTDAWTDKLEAQFQAAEDVMNSASAVNVAIEGDRDTLLNGYWRVRAGV